MGTYNMADYRRVLESRKKRLKNMNSVSKAANFMVQRAIKLAPIKTGETLRGIRGRKINKNKYKVESYVSGSFKQNIWANRNPGRFFAPKMWWNKGQPTSYGDGTHRTSGVPGFFTLAGKLTKKKFKDVAVKEFNKIMRS